MSDQQANNTTSNNKTIAELRTSSPEHQSNNKTIAKNTIMLYLRMFLTMVVGLYTSRVVLATLGVEDYGIYGVVGGVVGMLGFLNASMSGATSRFLTFELGKGNKEGLEKTFSSAMIVHIMIALVVLVIAETVGLWFLCNKLVIPEGRMFAAHVVYQLSILSAMFSITQVPYNSAIIAHEEMDVYAYVEILNVTLKLLIVYLLVIGNFDKLILYSILMLGVSILIMMVYRVYCVRKFEESHFHWIWDREYLKPLVSFSGWDLYGNMCFSIRQQGTGFVLNAFYGVVLNAASGIAATVQGILLNFSTNVVTAIKPQIIIRYARQSYSEMNQLICMGTKAAVILLLLMTVPIYIKIEYILHLWLTFVPKGTIFMTKMLLILNLITSVNLVAIIGVHATGKMKLAGFLNGTLLLMSIPIMYLLLRIGLSYKECYEFFVIVGLLYFLCILFVLKKQLPQFEITNYIVKAILPLILAVCSSFGVSYYFGFLFVDEFLMLVFFCILSCLSTCLISYIVALSRSEKMRVINIIKTKIIKK